MTEEKNTQTESVPKKKRRLHKTRKVMGFSVKVFLEITIVSLLLVLIAGGTFVYFVSKDMLDTEFVRSSLEKAVNAELAPNRIETGGLKIEWANIFDRPTFRIDDVHFLNEDGERLLTLEELSVSISRAKLLSGRVRPREIIAKGLDLHFVRRLDGAVQMGFVVGPSYIIYRAEGGEGRAAYGSLSEIYARHLQSVMEDGILSDIQNLEIANSTIVFEDLQRDYALSFPAVNARFYPERNRLSLDVSLNAQNGSVRDNIEAGLTYAPRYQELQTRLATRNFNPFLWAALFDIEGINTASSHLKIDSRIEATFDNLFNTQSAEVVLQATEGKLDVPDLYNDPFVFEELSLNGFFNRQSLTFDIQDSRLNAYDVPITFEAKLPIPTAEVRAYSIPLVFNIAELNVPLAEPAFPDAHEDKPIYKWLTQRLTSGTVRDFNIALTLALERLEDGSWDGDVSSLLSDFSFENLTVDYKNPLIPITGAKGTGVIDSGPDTMTIKADTGNFDDLRLSEITVGIRDLLAKKKSTVDLDFKASGPLKSFFLYLAREPIAIGDKIDFDMNSVTGQGDMHAKISFPTKEDLPLEEIKMDISADLTDAVIPKLIKDIDVSAPLAKFTLKDGLMRAEGDGRLAGRGGSFVWQQYMKSAGKPFKMKVEADVLTDVNLRRQFGVEIEDFITGLAPADVIYTSFADDTADLKVSSDLTGAQVHYRPLGYLKPVGEVARASLTAKLEDGEVRSIQNLSLTGPQLNLNNGNLEFQGGDLKSLRFPPGRIGQTNAGVTLTYSSPRAVRVEIKGDVIDARTLLSDRKTEPYSGPALRLSAEAPKLLTHAEESLSNTKVFLTMLENGDISQFEMDAQAGDGAVYVRYKPDASGSPNLTARMNDAGAALRAFGLYQDVRGGIINVTGTSSDPTWIGNVSGNFLMEDFSVRNAPVLAKLINAMSLPGLGQLLGNDGVRFAKLTADFQWNSRPEGAMINVKNGRTSGSELGLTFEGDINRANGTLNLNGTIVPVSTLNNLVGGIPLFGPIITGGTGSLIAATYRIRGPYATAEVNINPLSALAPGLVRRILFED